MTPSSPSPRDVEQLVERMTQRCRAAGMPVTPQRVAIYRALVATEDHPSPETLYRRVHPQMPSLSLATIYKTLTALAELGLVQEVSSTGESKRYDGNVDRHHHLVCTACGRIIDIHDERLDAVAPPPRLAGFSPRTLTVHITGICAACNNTRNKTKKETKS